MRKMVLLVLMLLPIGAEARPDTHALLANQSDTVTLTKIDAHRYRIEICPSNRCDAFESASSPLLDDYVYLYSVHVERFPDFAASTHDGHIRPMAFINEAEDKGYAQQVLDIYSAKYGCDKSDQMCVLKGLKKAGAIKQYDVNYDEGSRTQELVSVDAEPIAASDVIERAQEFDGKTLTLYGYVVVDSINIPHMFPSKAEAEKVRNDNYGIDLLPATHRLDVASRYQKVSCVMLSGIFHAPNPHAGLGTLTSKVGSIEFTELRGC